MAILSLKLGVALPFLPTLNVRSCFPQPKIGLLIQSIYWQASWYPGTYYKLSYFFVALLFRLISKHIRMKNYIFHNKNRTDIVVSFTFITIFLLSLSFQKTIQSVRDIACALGSTIVCLEAGWNSDLKPLSWNTNHLLHPQTSQTPPHTIPLMVRGKVWT